MTTNEKLEILAASGTIRDVTKDQVLRLVPFLEERTGGDYGTGVGQMLVVHLAMAMERAHLDEVVEPSDASGEVSSDSLLLAQEILRRLSDGSGIEFESDAETAYVGAYLDAVTQGDDQ